MQNQTIHEGTGHGINRPDPELMQLSMLRIGLAFEAKCPGMRMTRGPKCTTRARKLGFKGKPEAIIAAIEKRIEERELEIWLHNVAVTTPTS